jgi:hypothetical protein
VKEHPTGKYLTISVIRVNFRILVEDDNIKHEKKSVV